jgi:cell division protein FtsB
LPAAGDRLNESTRVATMVFTLVENEHRKRTASRVNHFNFTSMAKPKKKNFFTRFRAQQIPAWMRNKYFLTLMAFLTWMLFFDRNDLVSQVQLRMKLSDYRNKKEYYEQQIKDVKREKQELLTNRDSLEQFAREEYMMKKENEDLYVIVAEEKK